MITVIIFSIAGDIRRIFEGVLAPLSGPGHRLGAVYREPFALLDRTAGALAKVPIVLYQFMRLLEEAARAGLGHCSPLRLSLRG